MEHDIYQTQVKQGRLEDTGEFPKVLLIDTISYCNLKCSMCLHKDMKRKKGVMSWDLFTKIVDEIAATDKNVRVWMVFFGEALLMKRRKPSIFDLIAYAKSQGLTDVVLNSNANLLDQSAAKGLINSGLDAIYIGIDAFNPDTYSKLRVGGNYEKTVQYVTDLVKLKELTNADKPRIYVQFVEMDINKDQKDAFIRFWREKGVTVKIRPKLSWGGKLEAPNLILGNESRWPCYWAMQTMSITDTGKVVTCAVDLDASFVAGDCNEQSLKQIWRGKLKELRNLHISKRFEELPEICRGCKDWQSARANYYTI